jgi:hypothetical protein
MEAIDQGLLDGFAARDAGVLRENVRKAIAARTYECILHPLGFYFIRLAEHEDTTIRLHYWPANHQEKGTAVTPYHDHVWSLCSCVLAGALENVLLQLDPDENGNFQVADINQVGNIDQVIPASSRVQIRIQSSQTYRADEFYEIPPRVFHCTNVLPEDAVLTVVKSQVVVQGGPRTLMPVGFGGHMPSRDPIPDSKQILLEISYLLNRSSSIDGTLG